MFGWGDPHITTTDGAEYTFNGLGEYWMVYAPGEFNMQTRLAKTFTADGDPTEATVFSGFVAREDATNNDTVSYIQKECMDE